MCNQINGFYLTPFHNKTHQRKQVESTDYQFDEIYDTLSIYLKKKGNINLQRAKEVVHTGDWWTKIREMIDCSSFIIADITNNNPNVMIEIGVAIESNKLLFLISQDESKKAPSNIHHLQIEKYDASKSGLNLLAEKIWKELNKFNFLDDTAYLESQKIIHVIPHLALNCIQSNSSKLFRRIAQKALISLASTLENGSAGEYEFSPDQYPSMLSFIQQKCKPIIKAISIVEGEEYFWPRSWGTEVLASTHPKSTRIFLFQKPDEVFVMEQVLVNHSKMYHVRIASMNKIIMGRPMRPSMDCILFDEPIQRGKNLNRADQNPVMVGYYKIVGLRKSVSFSTDKKIVDEYKQIYDGIFPESISFQSLKKKDAASISRQLFNEHKHF